MLSCSLWFSAPSFLMGGGLESRCVGRVYHSHRTHDPRSGSQDHHPSKNSVQKTICYNSTSNAPDDGRMYPKHVEIVARQQQHRTHDTRICSQDHPSKNSVHKTICCNSTSNAPDDGRMYPKHVELRIH
jgi:hypothetical protein